MISKACIEIGDRVSEQETEGPHISESEPPAPANGRHLQSDFLGGPGIHWLRHNHDNEQTHQRQFLIPHSCHFWNKVGRKL